MEDTNTTQFEKRVPTLEEFRGLRANAGWPSPSNENMGIALTKTLFGVCVKCPEGQTIGMGRVVGDGGVQVFITDVIVRKDWQNRGLGSEIMENLMQYVEANTSPETFVGLFSAFGRDKFYEKFGFIVRPNETFGPGMMLVHGKHDDK